MSCRTFKLLTIETCYQQLYSSWFGGLFCRSRRCSTTLVILFDDNEILSDEDDRTFILLFDLIRIEFSGKVCVLQWIKSIVYSCSTHLSEWS